MSDYCECNPASYPFVCPRTGQAFGRIMHQHCKRSRQVAGAVQAARQWVVAGCPVSPSDVIAERRAACQSCEHWTGWTCRVCGCTGLKWHVETATCPEGKW